MRQLYKRSILSICFAVMIVAMGYTAAQGSNINNGSTEVEVSWLGDRTVILYINDERYPMQANGSRTITLPVDDVMTVRVETPQNQYTAEDFLLIDDRDNAALAVWLDRNHVQFDFGTAGQLNVQNRSSDVAQNQQSRNNNVRSGSNQRAASSATEFERGISGYALTAGANYATFFGDDTDELDGLLGYNIGGVLWYDINPDIRIETGLLISQRGVSASAEEFGQTASMELKMRYITVPIMYNYSLPTNDIDLLGGLNLSYLSAVNSERTFNGNTETESSKEGFNDLDIGVIFGGRYTINENFQARILYSISLSNMYDDNGDVGENYHGVLKTGLLYTF